MYQLKKLWKIQQMEIEEGKLKQSLEKEQQRVEAKMLEDAQEIELLERRLETIGKNRNKLKQQIRNEEDLAEQLETKKADLNRKLYGGEVSNPKELQEIQGQVDNSQQQLTAVEDKTLTLLERLETKENKLVKLTGELEAKKESQGKENLPLIRAKEEIELKLASVRLEIEKITQLIDENSLEFYRRIKPRGNKTVIAKVLGEMCGACHMEQPMNLLVEARKGKSLVKCENCGKILLVD